MKSEIHLTKVAVGKDGRLKAGTETARFATDSILAKWACPICAELKEFQIYLSKNLRAYECSSLCNLHAGAVANSSPAEAVATLFWPSCESRIGDQVFRIHRNARSASACKSRRKPGSRR
jgi:hypothetical protein